MFVRSGIVLFPEKEKFPYKSEKSYSQGNSDYFILEKSIMLPNKGIGSKPGTTMLKGWGMLFHPDLISGASLGHNIKEYTFFSYESREALHLSVNYFGDLIKKETGLTPNEYRSSN